MTEPFSWNVYSYINESRGWKRSYIAFSQEEDENLTKSFRKEMVLKSIRSYVVEDSEKRIPILREVMAHKGSEKGLLEKIERILQRD